MVVVDKIGILIEGYLVLMDIVVVKGFDCDDVFVRMVVVEVKFEYFVVCVIVDVVWKEGFVISGVFDFVFDIGYGVCVIVNGDWIEVGVDCYMIKFGLDVDEFFDIVVWFGNEGKMLFFVVIDGWIVVIVVVVDLIKFLILEVIVVFYEFGIKVVMIIGDNWWIVEVIVVKFGIDEVVVEVLLEGKVEMVCCLKVEYGSFVYVGDGINDVLVLVEVDVGFVIGIGIDIVIEIVDVVFMFGSF